jgi:sec-independent protein translocase protein TatA
MNSMFAAFGIGGTELILILAVVLLLFGGSKLPALAKGLGQSIKEFKKAQREDEPAQKTTPVEPTKH